MGEEGGKEREREREGERERERDREIVDCKKEGCVVWRGQKTKTEKSGRSRPADLTE